MNPSIRILSEDDKKRGGFTRQFTGCLVLTHDRKILVQKRPPDWRFGGYLSVFGGEKEAGETATEAVIRELKEELGASASPSDVVYAGAMTEAVTQHEELVEGFFWHDRYKAITGCYEGEAEEYDDVNILLSQKITEDLYWLLTEACARNFIKGRHI